MTFIELLRYFKDNQIIPKVVDEGVLLFGDSTLITEEVLQETKRKESRILSFLQHEPHKIDSVEKRQYYPATSAQRRLYFLQKINDQSSAYNVSLAIPDINDDIESIKEAVARLIKRHECLRTSFFLTSESLYQRVWENVDIQIDQGAGEVISEAFDLNELPLIRISYNRQENGLGSLRITMHHIITDGVSQGIIQRDLLAMLAGRILKPQRLQYRDYAYWFQKGMKSFLRREQDYWLQQFKGCIPVLTFPGALPRPEKQQLAGTNIDFCLTPEEISELRKVSKECGLTPYMTMLTVIYILVAKLSGQTDVVIGTFVSGRGHPGLEDVVGMFVNTLPLRCVVSSPNSFRSLFQEVKEKVLDAMNHQDYPFEDLIDKLLSRRDASRNPLFDVAFSMSNGKEEALTAMTFDESGFKVTYGCTAKFDLTFSVIDFGRQVVMSINYSDALFEIEMVKIFISTFRTILSSLSTKLDEKVAATEIISIDRDINLVYTATDTKIVQNTTPAVEEDPISAQLKEIWSQVLKIPKEEIHAHSNVFELGGHSLKLLNIYTLIKKKFGTTVPLMYLYQHPTVEEARHALINKIFYFNPVNHFNNAASETIFCFPPIIGVSYCYSSIAGHLKNYRISCFNYFKTDNLVQSYVNKIIELQGQSPYILLGYSIGGMLLYPVAKELERRGLKVSKIITLDGYWDPYPGIKNPDLIYSLFEMFAIEYNVDVLRQEFYDVVFEYDNFLKKLEYTTKINADIHFIISQGYEQIEPEHVIDNEIARIKARMGEFTTQSCTVYKGYGIHNTMLDGDAGPLNADIVTKILSL